MWRSEKKTDILLCKWRSRSVPDLWLQKTTYGAGFCISVYATVQNNRQQEMFKDTEWEECLKQKGLGSKRNCFTTLSWRYCFWVCSSHVCTWKKRERDRYKHSWVLAQSFGQGVMTEAGKMREDFKERYREWCFNMTKWGTSSRQQKMKRK